MLLYLVRHGETKENINGIVQGWLDTKLNKTGIEQAKTASGNFNEAVDAIYSSDLTRCRQTAEFFKLKNPEIPYYEDSRIRERNFGDAQGTNKAIHNWEIFWASSDEVSIKNAETLNDFNKRVTSFIDYLKTRHRENESLLIVTHGGTITRFQNIINKNLDYIPAKNCEVIKLLIV